MVKDSQVVGNWKWWNAHQAPGAGAGCCADGWESVPSVGFLANCRLSKDYERKVQTSETLIQVAMMRLLLARLGRKSEPIPTHKERAA